MKKYLSGIATGLIIAMAFSVCLTFSEKVYLRISGAELPPNRKIEEIVNLLNKKYVGEFEVDDLYEGLYTGFVYGVGDPYTTYLSRNALDRYMQDIEGSFSGIGVYVTPDMEKNQLMVLSAIEGSPASKVDIRPKDVIAKIDGVSITGDDLEQAVSMMKGSAGTKVTVTIYRSSTNETFDVGITRMQIEVPSVFPKMIDDNIGYIRISSFEGGTFDQFMKALNDLEDRGMRGLIIDVRNNPGGLLTTVVDITDELVSEGTIVYTTDKEGKSKYFDSDEKCLDIPLVILINENSASASEILAGAVKDHNAGKLVGDKTFGKGLVQSIYALSDGSGVKVTVSQYFTPNGTFINGIGIEPDVKAELEEEKIHQISLLEPEEDTQLIKAIDVIKASLKVD